MAITHVTGMPAGTDNVGDAWTNPGNAIIENDTPATLSLGGGSLRGDLIVGPWDVTPIPPTARLLACTFPVRAKSDDADFTSLPSVVAYDGQGVPVVQFEVGQTLSTSYQTFTVGGSAAGPWLDKLTRALIAGGMRLEPVWSNADDGAPHLISLAYLGRLTVDWLSRGGLRGRSRLRLAARR